MNIKVIIEAILKNSNKKILIVSYDNHLYELINSYMKQLNINLDYKIITDEINKSEYDYFIIEEKLLKTYDYDKILESLINNCNYKIIHSLSDLEILNLIKEYSNIYSFDDIKDRTVYRGVFIGKWKYKQRRLYKKNKIDPFIKTELEILGENFKTKLSFNEMVVLIKEYMKLNSCSYVSIKQNTVYRNIHIGDWKSNQRRKYKEGKLDKFEEEILRLLGEDFNIGSYLLFDEMVVLIKEYMSLNNVDYNDIARNTIYKGKNIGQFRLNKRLEYKKGLLSEEETLKLIELGETFEEIKVK